jgi:hypothetical protein
MELIKTLREQANALRSLETYSEANLVRDNLRSLIDRCEKLADEAEREIAESRPQRGSS